MALSFFKIQRTIYYLLFLLYFPFSINAQISYEMNGNIIVLNTASIITQIKATKKNSNPYNYLLGIFEASNDISFSDGFPIAMIKEDVINDPNTITIGAKCKEAYKYIRYLPPNSINAQLENFEFTSGSSGIFLATNLPLMVIKTENSKEPDSTETYINCNVKIINSSDSSILDQDAEIRVRGHSTASLAKKPWKIKFKKKQIVLDIDSKNGYKSWAVLANHYDESLIRNDLAFEISRNIGLPFTPRCRFLDVIMNGSLRGNYYICDQVEIKKGRVDIKIANDEDDPDITGGYLIEIDGRAGEEEKYFFTEKGLIGEIKDPDSDDITKEEENYIKLYLNKVEKQVYLGNLQYLDLPTFYRYFIMQEFCGDIDTTLSSFHLTKRRGDDKLYFGPVWDYDLSFDSDDRLIPTNQKPLFTFYYGASAGTCRHFLKTILLTNNSMSYINQTWNELKQSALTFDKLNSYITQESNKILESAKLNYYRWFNSKIENAETEYKSNVAIVTNYVKQRFDRLTYLINTYDFAARQLKINFSFLFILILFLL